jgi:hypothetical protein
VRVSNAGPDGTPKSTIHTKSAVVVGAGVGLIVGAALGNAGVGMVLGAAAGLAAPKVVAGIRRL